MKKICFHIQKGGVGKTSVSGNVAAMLAADGKKTLLIDADPQGNASSWFCRERVRHDIAGVLAGTASLEDAVCRLTDTLSLLPVIAIDGTLKAWAETELVRNPRSIEFLLHDIEGLGFDYAVLDCSPSFSLLERSIISSCDEVVNPLAAEFFSIDGVEHFAHELRAIEKANRRTILNDKIVVNLLNRSFSRHKAFLEELEKLPYRIFVIPQDSKVAECQIAHQSLIDFDPRAKAVPYFRELTEAVK